MIRAARGRFWRGLADARRLVARQGSARPAMRLVEPDGRRGSATWERSTAAGHDRYRRGIEPAQGAAVIVCVTRRPHRLADVLENVGRQRAADLELVVVANDVGFPDGAEEAVEALGRVLAGSARLLRRPPTHSLGRCLNDAMSSSDARFVAKFDDDDRYGADYLSDALRAHRYAGAGVVGKHTYFAHLESADRTVLRFPGHEFTYSGTLAGGTLVIDRDRVGDLQFEDRSIGEDRAFLAACHRHGISTFSADRFNFVQSRGADNTWQIAERDFLTKTAEVGAGLPLDLIDR